MATSPDRLEFTDRYRATGRRVDPRSMCQYCEGMGCYPEPARGLKAIQHAAMRRLTHNADRWDGFMMTVCERCDGTGCRILRDTIRLRAACRRNLQAGVVVLAALVCFTVNALTMKNAAVWIASFAFIAAGMVSMQQMLRIVDVEMRRPTW